MSPRESIAMAAEESRAFLGSCAHAVLATIGADGTPDAALVECRLDGDAVVIGGLDADTKTAISVDARAAICVEQCPTYYEIRGVSAHAPLEDLGHGEYRLPLTDVVAFDFAKIRARS